MKTQDIAQRWLDFFAARGHTVVPSASLVSPDPSVLFNIAGMVQFIPYLSGREKAPYPRAVNVQKCIRTADIEEVGRTVRHGTFFQMCGNFSFGDYFKEEAIRYAWELLTTPQASGGYGLDPERLWVTYYQEGEDRDTEAQRIWREVIGLPEERIQGTGKSDNYWHTGQPGPGGPCSEIYYDRGEQYGQYGGPIVDETRYVEIWNLVFMQYQLSAVRSKTDFDVAGELPNRNIDTGLGLERLAMILQGVENLYETDQVRPVLDKAAQLADKTYTSTEDPSDPRHGDDVRLRVVADHVRSALMVISDGVTPSNEGRGYVLRRLIRRAVRAMRLMGVTEPVLPELLPMARDAMSGFYPVVAEDFERISAVAYAEEQAFLRTISAGTTRLEEAVTAAKKAGTQLSGSDAFALHDTYGFPIDLTLEMAQEAGVSVDADKFRALMQEQKERARADAKEKKTGHADVRVFQELLAADGATRFTGYTELAGESRIKSILQDGQALSVARQGEEIELVLDETPFYAEGGGQAADTGIITADGATLEVLDVQAPVKGLSVHRAVVREGEFAIDTQVRTAVDATRRHAAEQAHTGTHLVHAALRQILGPQANQRGSFNKAGYLRFDFAWGQALSQATRSEIEEAVNQAIQSGFTVSAEEMPLDQAKALGAMALFGENYGSQVRVVEIDGPWSRELCGGTHVANTSLIGSLTLLGEQSVGSGNRRVEALVGLDAFRHVSAERTLVSELSEILKVPAQQLTERVQQTVEKLRATEKELEKLRTAQLLSNVDSLLEQVNIVGGVQVLSQDLGPLGSADDLRAMALNLRDKLQTKAGSQGVVIALTAVVKDRPLILVATDPQARERGVKAGSLVRVASGVLGGGGGGKDDMAQGGGSDSQKIPEALSALTADLSATVGQS